MKNQGLHGLKIYILLHKDKESQSSLLVFTAEQTQVQ